MDAVLRAAIDRQEELEHELKKVRDFISLYRTLANTVRSDSVNIAGTTLALRTASEVSVDKVSQEEARESEAPDAPPPRRVRVRDNPKPDAVVAAAVEVIREAGRPLTRREIHASLTARGMEVRGADAIKALGTMLWRSGRYKLTQIEGEGYWPADTNYGFTYIAPPHLKDPDLRSDDY